MKTLPSMERVGRRSIRQIGTLLFNASLLTTLVLLFAFSSGCSFFLEPPGTPEAKATTVAFTNRYLTAILRGSFEEINDRVIWSEYIQQKPDVTRELVETQHIQARRHLKLENHPLYNLSVIDVWMRGDHAELLLQRIDGPFRPEVKVELMWAVNGWGVTGDNIFGEDGILKQALDALPKTRHPLPESK